MTSQTKTILGVIVFIIVIVIIVNWEKLFGKKNGTSTNGTGTGTGTGVRSFRVGGNLGIGPDAPSVTTSVSQPVSFRPTLNTVQNYGGVRTNRQIDTQRGTVNKEDCLCSSGKIYTCIGYKNCSHCCNDDSYPG